MDNLITIQGEVCTSTGGKQGICVDQTTGKMLFFGNEIALPEDGTAVCVTIALTTDEA